MEHGERLKAALADRYLIEREIGSGGMATVYLAQDLKHDRQVAVKVLRPEVAASLGTERFLAEIRLTARLQHPHIVPLFDSGEADTFLYYVMPYIQGESLRARFEREQRLDVEGMLGIARPVAQALGYAHELGVVHRDIKPENILLSRGQPFVTDFGIARAVSVAGGERLTATGVSVGTPAYMSPEQVLGEESIDERSDVYSLGCVIYEMLSGTPPFSGATVQALLARRLTGPPPQLTNVPSPVDEVIRRSLATAPQDRFGTTVALADALVEAARRTPAGDLSIVVLPFENLSSDPDNEFFADGLTEELIAELSGVQALRVISRTSAMQFKGGKKGVPSIARELNVRYALEGSVRRASDSVRITAQLIDASTDSHLWAERYTGKLEDVFDLQEKLARRIVDGLRVALTPAEDQHLADRPQVSGAAYECYLRARHETARMTESGLDRALQHLEAAIEMEGENAFLLASMAQVHTAYLWGGFRIDEETQNAAERYAKRALALDPAVAPAHGALGGLAYMTGDPKSAFVHLHQAVSLGTDDPNDLAWYLLTAGTVGRTSATGPLVERLVQTDPLNSVSHWCRAVHEWFEDRYETALESVLVALRLDPANVLNRCFGVYLMAANGRLDEARALLDEWLADTPGHDWAQSMPFWLYAFEGRRNECLNILERLLADEQGRSAAEADACAVLWNVQAFSLIGETDQALEWLEHGLEMGLINYPFLAEKDRLLANLRGDSRFQRLMERVKKAWEEFEA
ncbi:MAG: protein kinase [Gemmatimonadota bacterium]|jgi:serine/threonine protein kinase/tetratricopeptide (TPR) repeat protein